MPRKNVYLFELDSVRKTDSDIIEGQRALYHEIVENGNIVVLTFNQLVDSRGFFSLISNPEYYNNLVKLFEQGSIRISQFGKTRTVSQYLLNSIAEDKRFIYSAIPIKFSQKRLTALMRRSLTYSDLTEINEYREGGKRTDDEVKELFEEVIEGHVKKAEIGVAEMRSIATNLYWLLSIILRISALQQIYISPRDFGEYENLKLSNILKVVTNASFEDDDLWADAVSIIRNLDIYQEKDSKQKDNRSAYLREIGKIRDKALNNPKLCRACQYAAAIIDLCYNYASEISICNTSKRYDVCELETATNHYSRSVNYENIAPQNIAPENIALAPENIAPSFLADFRQRLDRYWQQGVHADLRFLTPETNTFKKFEALDKIPRLADIVRLTGYVQAEEKHRRKNNSPKNDSENTVALADETNEAFVPRYEYAQSLQQHHLKHIMLTHITKKFGIAMLCVAIACLIELTIDAVQDLFDIYVDASSVLPGVIETILFLFITEFVTQIISRRVPGFLALSEALGSIGQLFVDGGRISTHSVEGVTNSKNVRSAEPLSSERPINYIVPRSISDYQSFVCESKKKAENKSSEDLFKNNSMYPLANVSDQNVIKELIREEEMYGYTFGIVYKSDYNRMVVDPIEVQNKKDDAGSNTESSYYPYERIIPTAGNGVVIVPRYHEKYVLIDQNRHAIRDRQLSFPRGYAEPDCDDSGNAARELFEELQATPQALQHLGTITSDSGLTSNHVAIYLADIDGYHISEGYEGIISTRELNLSELHKAIFAGEIDDSFTICAFTLLLEHEKNLTSQL